MPFTDKQGNEDAKDRFVAPQPLMFGKNYNLRKLMQLPHHLLQLSDMDNLKSEALCNMEFLVAKLKATSLK